MRGRFLLDRIAETIEEYKKTFSHIPFHSGSWQKLKPTASLDLIQQPADFEIEWINKFSKASFFASCTPLKDVKLFLMQKEIRQQSHIIPEIYAEYSEV